MEVTLSQDISINVAERDEHIIKCSVGGRGLL